MSERITVSKEDFEAFVELMGWSFQVRWNSSKFWLRGIKFEGAKGELKAEMGGVLVYRPGNYELTGKEFYGRREEYTHVELRWENVAMFGEGARTHIDGKYPHTVLWNKVVEILK